VRACRVRVRGRFQRVGYRRFVLDLAQDLGLAGYVGNERDGSVTISAQGEGEALKGFLEAVREPPRGVVIEASVEEAKSEPGRGYFEVELGSVQEELQEGFGSLATALRGNR